MTFYSDFVDEIRSTAIHKKLVGRNSFQSLILGGLEVEKIWNFQKEIHPHGFSIHLNYEKCQHLFNDEPEKSWNFFKIGAIEKMKEIAATAPNDSDSIIYCDETNGHCIVLIEVSKSVIFSTLQEKLSQIIKNNFYLNNETVFNAQFKLLNEKLLRLPLTSYIDRSYFTRYLVIEL